MTTPAKQPDEFDAIRTVVQTLEQFSPDQQKRMLRWTQEKLGLPATSPVTAPATPILATSTDSAGPAPAKGGTTHGASTDIKTFMEQKAPKSDNQFAAAVAYYYRFEAPETQRKETINKDDLVEACRMVQRKRPGKPAQVLINTLAQGLLDKTERGQYRINSVGENLVAMVLPNQDGGNAVRAVKRTGNKAPKKAKRAGS